MFYKKYDFGEVSVHYIETFVVPKSTTVCLVVSPRGIEPDLKNIRCSSLVQVAFTGDEPLFENSLGFTMTERNSTLLKVTRQVQFMSGNLNTYLADDKGNEYVHKLYYNRETGVFTVSVRYDNRSKTPRTLEYLSSFSIEGFGSNHSVLHRMTDLYRLKSQSLKSFVKWGESRAESYPFAAIEGENYVLGVQMEAPFPWQMQAAEHRGIYSLSGGIADYETGHWRKTIRPHEGFETRKAFFTVQKSLNDAFNALLRERERRTAKGAEDMSAVFHDVGKQASVAKINRTLKALKNLPVGYYVLDGTREPDRETLAAAVQRIKAAGLQAGLRLEPETVERGDALFDREELLLKRDGVPITSKNRRFLDLRLPEVKNGFHEKVLRLIRETGFTYLKLDIPDSFGFGCDSPDGSAMGEGRRQMEEERLYLLERAKSDETAVEICGKGTRIEPLSTSKAFWGTGLDENPYLPIKAANLSRVLPAHSLLIGAAVTKDEADSKTIYSLCTAMFGRIALSGDVHLFEPEKTALVEKGLSFYWNIRDIVCNGEIKLIDCDTDSNARRQLYVKDFGERRLVIVHFFDCESAVRIPLNGYEVKAAFTDLVFGVRNNYLRIVGQNYHAGTFLLEKTKVNEVK